MKAPRLNPGRALVATVAAVAVLAPATANAAEQADLRVEGGGRPLAAATYLTDTARIKTASSSSCKGSGDVKTVQGPTALGLLWSGSAVTKQLRPVAVSDEFSFGLLVCGISSFVGGDTAYWLYKVDHKTPEIGADQYPLKGSEQVLWYFSDTTANVNTGDELVLQAPARAEPGGTVAVRVWSYDAAGKRTPAAGAVVQGEDEATADGQGRATLDTPTRGTLRLRAERGADVPSQTVSVCITAKPSCSSRRGKRIIGTAKADRIAGTKGPDTVSTGAGADRVSVRGGGRDTVRCGKGRDRVSADRSDRVGRDCEVVKRG
jgi:RTX calcium-binding nonapeptide repeat (4 copies)